MKKWFIALLASVTLPLLVTTAQAQQFEEGVHYEVIADEGTAKPEINEFFSFYCVHCFRFEPIAKAMKERFPDAFTKTHINPGQGVIQTMAQAYAYAKKLGKDEEIGAAVFDYNFVKRNMLETEEDIRNVFILHDVSGEDFDKAMSSFSIRAAANKMQQLGQKYDITATPTFVVNGKYKMKVEGFRESENFAEDWIALADYLLNKDS
ncbi:thiol:disulfide interchange protein DsbA/DsbL [Idiomarina xiamenensis]|uniref:Thiol:disulfide interchange protein n=1 Tax=Idiomarina xiamenensis 10-D-4 TaxID=740709 RepID=K2KPC1_9GAMM|nr:thiol:disulfide interchange protein DsbA/DsbL [Idiomarina xiamenensis]EKE79405.1 disulfide isomerase [Idiomarina xiamenensis 10-D-4]